MEHSVKSGLSGNQLKGIALVCMTLDHIGLQLFPQSVLLRILGRLSFPIFAYMIAEGCQYTRHRTRYLLSMATLSLLCQIVYFLAMGSLYQCVLVTFSLSISLIYAIDYGRQGGGPRWIVPIAVFAGVCYFTLCNPFPGSDYSVDYGLWGVMLPVFAYLGTSRKDKFALTSAGLILLNRSFGGIQWFSLFALIPLYVYNGQRGKRKLKYLFYIYYPLHLVVLYGIRLMIR